MMRLLLFNFQRPTAFWGLLMLLLLGSSQVFAQAPANDNCAGAVSVPVLANCVMPANGTVAGATQSVPPTANCGFSVFTANDVWYSFVATNPTQYITLAPRFAAIMDVRSGTCTNSSSVFCNSVFSGNTNSTLVPGLIVGQTYFIRVYASGTIPPAGISSTFALCVSPGPNTTAPVNDECAGAIDVPVQAGGVCASQTPGDNTNATSSTGVQAPGCANYVGGDIWFKVTVPASGTVTVQTVTPNAANELNDTGLALYSGTCASLTQIGCDDDGGGGVKSLLTASGRTPGEILYIRVWGFGGGRGAVALCAVTFTTPTNDDCAGAVPLTVNPTCTPTAGTLTATTQSLPPTTNCGFVATANDVWYSFVATGTTQTLTYTGNVGVVLDVRSGTCANSTSVFCTTTFNNQDQAVGGLTVGQTYFLRIYSNSNFLPANSQFTICVTPGPVPPANDECASAIAIPVTPTCTNPLSTTLANATQSLAPTTSCGFANSANDVWYSFVATGTTQTVTFSGLFGAVLDVRSGTCANSTSVFCTTTFNNQAQAIGGLTTGQTYFLRVYANSNFPPNNSAFTLCVSPGPVPPANDECAQAVSIPVTPTCSSPTSSSIANATQSLAPTANCGFANTANDVWYSFVATGITQTVTFTGQFGAVLEVFSGTCTSATSLLCTTTFNNQAQPIGGLTTGQTYFLRVYANSNFPPNNPAFTLCVSPGPVPPANDECAGAIPVPVTTACTAPVSGSFYNATQSTLPSTGCGFANVARDVWYSFVANGSTQTITVNAPFGTVVDVRSGTCANSTPVSCTTTFSNQGAVVGGLTSGQTYFLRLYPNTNSTPTPTTGALTVCITDGPPPAINDECAQAIPISVVQTCSNSTNGTVQNSSQSLAPTAACGNTTVANDVWYSFVASAPTQLVTLTARFAAVLDVRSGTCANSTSLFCSAINPSSTAGTPVSGLTTGQTYFVRIYANNNFTPTPTSSTFTICITPAPTPPANDECAQAVALTVSTTCTPTSGTVIAASQSLPSTMPCGFGSNQQAQDVWYSFVATGGTQSIQLAGAFNSQFTLDVRSGTCATSTSIFCTNVFGSNAPPQLVGGLTIGQTYFLRIYSATFMPPVGAQGAFTVCVTPGPTPPVNDECAGAIDVPVQFGTTCVTQTGGNNAGSTSSTSVPAPPCAAYQGEDIWFKVTVPGSGTVTVQTVAPTTGFDVGDTGMSIYSGTCNNLTQIGCDDDGGVGTKSLLALTGRTAGEVLYIRVWRFGGNITGEFALCATTPSNCQPPFSLNSSNITANTATIGWLAGAPVLPGITYTVEYGPQGFALGTGTVLSGLTTASASLNNLQAGTRYCFYVRQACGGVAGGNSAYAGPECFTTPNIAPCASPTALTTSGVTTTAATVSWQAGAPGAGVTYTLEYGPLGFVPGTGTVVTGLTGLTTQLTSLMAGRDYCVYVRQTCPGGTGSSNYAGPQCFTTLTGSTCTPPSGLAANNLTANTADLSWVAGGTPTASTTYTVEYGVQGFTQGTGTLRANLTVPSLALTGLQPNTNYCYYVRQSCAGGGNSTYTGPRCFTTAPGTASCSAPSALAAGSITSTGATLSWVAGSSPAGPITFEVEYGPQGFTPGAGTVVSGLQSLTTPLSNLMPGTAYCFYVRQSCTGGSTSPVTGPFCFTTSSIALANDEPCGAVTLPVVPMTSPAQPVLSSNAGATVSVQPGTSVPTTCATNPTPRDVWFTMTPAAGTPLTLSFSGAAAGLVRVFTAPNCSTGPFTLVACQGSGTPNTGLSTMTLTGLVPGQAYYVAVSGFGPNDTPGSFSVEASSVVLATRPQAETNALLVYPNPSNTGQLTLRLQGTSGQGEAVLLNAIGQSVMSFKVPAGTAEQVLVTKGLATGVYTLRIVVGTQVLTRKVVLE